MVKLDNIRFIEQIKDGCCPASINIVLDYYKNGTILDQYFVLSKLNNYSKSNNNASFFKSAKHVFENDSDYNELYEFKVIDTESKEDWIRYVKNHIDRDIPVIISTNTVGHKYHITVIYGYDEVNDTLFEMCPEIGNTVIPFVDKLKNYDNGGTDLLIITKK